jgi:hypothetical protein
LVPATSWKSLSTSRSPPIGKKRFSSTAFGSIARPSAPSSPISSRNSTPSCASRISPARSAAPCSVAPFTSTNAPLARWRDFFGSYMRRARCDWPALVGPLGSTGARASARLPARSRPKRRWTAHTYTAAP